MRSIWQCNDALATGGDTSSASSACAFTLIISILTSRLPSRSVWVYLRASKPRLPGHHNLGRVTEIVAIATCATVSNVVGMIGTEAVLCVQTVAMKA